MKRIVLVVLLLLFSIVLVGCDWSERLSSINDTSQNNNEESKQEEGKEDNNESQGDNQGEDQGDNQGTKVEYTVTFNSNGGSSVENQLIEENGKATKPSDPERTNFIFSGWYLGFDLFDFANTPITSDITLVAGWKNAPTHTPTFSGSEEDVVLNVGDEFNALDGITATDEYGADVSKQVSVSHLVPLDESGKVTTAGEYQITYSITLAGIEYTLSRKLIVNEVEVVAGYADYTIEFMDGTVGSPYSNVNWKQEVYYSDWGPASNQMNCREKNGVRVVNFTSGFNTTYRYTYSNGEVLGIANKLTFKAGNYFNPNQPIPIKIVLIDVDGVSHYILGSAEGFYSFDATTDLIDMELVFEKVNVASLRVVCKGGASAYQYFYVSAMHLSYDENAVVPSGDNGGDNNGGSSDTGEDDTKGVNLFADLSASGNDYISPNWKIENYRSTDWFGIDNEENWGVMTTVQMRSRMRGETHVANFACGNTPMRYTFSKGESLGVVNTFSFKLANDWNQAGDIYIILKLVDVNGKEIYLFGGSSSYDTIPAQELIDYKLTFEEAEVKEVVILIASMTTSTYLYMGDAYLYNEVN